MQTRGLFITATDTGVGKTYVAAFAARELREAGVHVGVYKPACSGAVRGPEGSVDWEDVRILAKAAGDGIDLNRVCPQRFEAPLAPPMAARLEGKVVDARLLRDGARWWSGRVEILLVEGVGGLLCPLTETETIADLAVDLGYPLLIVSRAGLGTINHTLLTVEAARRRNLAIAGILLNQVEPPESDQASGLNEAELAQRCDAPLLGVLRHGPTEEIARNGRPVRVDWRALTASARQEG